SRHRNPRRDRNRDDRAAAHQLRHGAESRARVRPVDGPGGRYVALERPGGVAEATAFLDRHGGGTVGTADSVRDRAGVDRGRWRLRVARDTDLVADRSRLCLAAVARAAGWRALWSRSRAIRARAQVVSASPVPEPPGP